MGGENIRLQQMLGERFRIVGDRLIQRAHLEIVPSQIEAITMEYIRCYFYEPCRLGQNPSAAQVDRGDKGTRSTCNLAGKLADDAQANDSYMGARLDLGLSNTLHGNRPDGAKRSLIQAERRRHAYEKPAGHDTILGM